jgi:hypothetical protein
MLLTAVMAMTMGCATVPAEEQGLEPGADSCDAAKAQGLVGRGRSEELGAQALRLSGARTVRWIPEGGIVTMDYREDRLNIYLDRQNKVERITCG